MRFVLLGAGSIGLRHMKNLTSLGHQVSVVYDPSPARIAEIQKIDPKARGTNDDAQALAEPCDAVVICSPPSDHLRQLNMALDRGKDVFVEKPLSHTLKGTAEAAKKAEKDGRIVLVGCNLRFFSSLQRIKQLLDSGSVGRPLSARIYGGYYLPYWRPHLDYRQSYSAQARQGGGVLLDFIHELDFMRWLFGEPVEVLCMAGTASQLTIDTEDLVAAIIRFESGLIAELHLDYLQPTYRRGMEIIGEARALTWDYIDQTIRLYSPEDRTYQVLQEHIGYERNTMFLQEMEHFEKCLRRETVPELDLRGARRALAFVEALKQSARERRLVHISEFADV
jgi:predicted dehydrogenase